MEPPRSPIPKVGDAHYLEDASDRTGKRPRTEQVIEIEGVAKHGLRLFPADMLRKIGKCWPLPLPVIIRIGNFSLIAGALNVHKDAVITQIFKGRLLVRFLQQEGKHLKVFRFSEPFVPNIASILGAQLKELSLPNVTLAMEDQSGIFTAFQALEKVEVCVDNLYDEWVRYELILLTKLRHLTLKVESPNVGIVNDVFKAYTHLKSLNLRNIHLGSQAIKAIVELTRLEMLSVRCDYFNVKYFSQLTHLTHLECEDKNEATGIINPFFPHFLVPLTKLQTLRLSNCSLANDTIFSSLKRLRTLQISDSSIDGTLTEGIGKTTHLTDLDLSNNFAHAEETFIDAFQNLTLLTRLNLMHIRFDADDDPDSATLLTNAISRLRNVRLLCLTLYVFEESVIKPLHQLSNLRSLELNFKESRITDGTVLLPWQKIIKLNFWNCIIELGAISHLSMMKIRPYA